MENNDYLSLRAKLRRGGGEMAQTARWQSKAMGGLMRVLVREDGKAVRFANPLIFIHAMSLDTMLIPVESSAIRTIGYAGGTLVVEFHSGRNYDYPGVPYPVFLELLNARSIGAYYNQHIRGQYR